MKYPFQIVRILFSLTVILIISCKGGDEKDATIVDDGADKSEVTETGKHIGSTTDSTTVVSDEPNPSND